MVFRTAFQPTSNAEQSMLSSSSLVSPIDHSSGAVKEGQPINRPQHAGSASVGLLTSKSPAPPNGNPIGARSSAPFSTTGLDNSFGFLPASSSSIKIPSVNPSVTATSARSRHNRTASYGTSLLDSLNESKKLQSSSSSFASVYRPSVRGHARHQTVSEFWDDGDDLDSLLDNHITNRLSADIYGSTASSSLLQGSNSRSQSTSPSNKDDVMRPIGSALSRPPNILGDINELAGEDSSMQSLMGNSSLQPKDTGVSSGHGMSGIIASGSPLRSSFSSTSLRSAFLRPRGASAHVPNLSTSVFDDKVWGTSLGQKSVSPVNKHSTSPSDVPFSDHSVASILMNKRGGRHVRHESEILPGQVGSDLRATSSTTSVNRLSNQLGSLNLNTLNNSRMNSLSNLRSEYLQDISGADVSESDLDQAARIRSYSFTKPVEDDDLDIDTLHAAATSDNPTAMLRKTQVSNMLRTHSRSKTMATPLGESQSLSFSQSSLSGLFPVSDSFGGHLPALSNALTTGLDRLSPQEFMKVNSLDSTMADAPPLNMSGRLTAGHSRQNSAGFLKDLNGGHTPLLRGLTQHGGDLKKGVADVSISEPVRTTGIGGTVVTSTDKGIVSTDSVVPTRSIWVGNLDPALSSEELIAKFGKYGRVESLRLLPDRQCAFVNFMRLEDAISAREEMQGGRLGNCIVRVNYGKGENYASSDAQAMQPTRALWIGNISSSTTPQILEEFFSKFGTIESARVLSHKNCGFVNFEKLEDAVRAKQDINGKELQGSIVRIGYAKEPVKGGPDAQNRWVNPVPSTAPLTISGRMAEASAIVGTTSGGIGNNEVLEPDYSLKMDESLVAFPFASELPPLPTPTVRIINNQGQTPVNPTDSSASGTISSPTTSELLNDLISETELEDGTTVNMIDQAQLREVRKRLDSKPEKEEFALIFDSLISVCVELCTDYVGNVLVQRLIEGSDDEQRLRLVNTVSPHIASIGVHKNGTWAVQKMIDSATTAAEQEVIVKYTKPYAPRLLLDQLGNYVVQCCLPFQDGRNQFIFDSIHGRCQEISQGRFGARSIRTCLEHKSTTRAQQKLVAVALVMNSATLATNANGSLLMNWLTESSNFPGRFRVLAPQVASHLRHLCMHKLGSSLIIKIVDQAIEPDARDLILNTLFFNPEPQVLTDILSDQVHGFNVVYSILTGKSIEEGDKARLAEVVQTTLKPFLHQGAHIYRRLLEYTKEILHQTDKPFGMPGYVNGLMAPAGVQLPSNYQMMGMPNPGLSAHPLSYPYDPSMQLNANSSLSYSMPGYPMGGTTGGLATASSSLHMNYPPGGSGYMVMGNPHLSSVDGASGASNGSLSPMGHHHQPTSQMPFSVNQARKSPLSNNVSIGNGKVSAGSNNTHPTTAL
ncbi:hypothetical protein H4219_004355 [Mycoemilia scoparia]|uniref:Uncharacterized protein n=1 Tax=Mycoemilia scoparia TaxID=417184 RepID=A0A9W7ZYJ8_9FUNG|nr:hypothetical protein H4219_004355 [Mycoemilia scoparia]